MSQKLYKVEDIQLLFKELKVEIKKLKCFIEDCCAKIPINVGSGATLFKRLYRNNWEFKSILPGSNINITEQDDTITINSTGGGGGSGWDLDGNSISNTNFLGTTNDEDIVFKRNNIDSALIAEEQTSFGVSSIAATDGKNTAIGVNSEAYFDSVSIGDNAESVSVSVAIGNNSYAGDTGGVAVGYEARGNVGGVAIGYQAITNDKGVAIGYQASAIQDQFALANNILYAKWRGIPYEFPSSQGAASTVLTNNGAGILSWQPSSTGTVTSVGLTMPTAFSVANSPVTTTGTLAVTATGNASQYIRGDGALGILPENSGGAGGVVYYFNGNTASSIAGNFEMSKTPDTGVPANFSKTGDGLIASFATNVGDPNITEIPTGIWLFKPYLSMATNAGSPKINTQVKIFDGIGYTTIATSDTFLVSNGTATSLYTFGIVIPQTTITITDRIVVEFYLSNSLGDTITLYTEDSFINSVATTIPSGIATLNGLNTTTQYLATGTTGTDFNISSATNTHTFNIPTASATNRGLLSTADWSTFNGKQNALGFTPEDVANKQSAISTDVNHYYNAPYVNSLVLNTQTKILIDSFAGAAVSTTGAINTNVFLESLFIPANTYSEGDGFVFNVRAVKSFTGSTQRSIIAKIDTASGTTSGVTIALYTSASSGNQYMTPLERRFAVSSVGLNGFSQGFSSTSDMNTTLNSTVYAEITGIDWTVDNWLNIMFQSPSVSHSLRLYQMDLWKI